MTTHPPHAEASGSEALLTRGQKIGLHLACLSRHRARGSLVSEKCSYYWAGIAREITAHAAVPASGLARPAVPCR